MDCCLSWQFPVRVSVFEGLGFAFVWRFCEFYCIRCLLDSGIVCSEAFRFVLWLIFVPLHSRVHISIWTSIYFCLFSSQLNHPSWTVCASFLSLFHSPQVVYVSSTLQIGSLRDERIWLTLKDGYVSRLHRKMYQLWDPHMAPLTFPVAYGSCGLRKHFNHSS